MLSMFKFTFATIFWLGKEQGFYLNKVEFPFSNDASCQVLLKLAQRFWCQHSGSGENENVNSLYRRTDKQGQREIGRQVIRNAHLSFYLSWSISDIL